MEVMLADSHNVYEMALDLTSPWTWVKSSNCKNCPKIDPLTYDSDSKQCKLAKLGSPSLFISIIFLSQDCSNG